MVKGGSWIGVTVACCVSACCWALFAAPSMAAETAVVFGEEEKIDTSCSALAKEEGVRFTISNRTVSDEGKGVTASVELDLLDDKGEEAKPSDLCGGLTLAPAQLTVPSGKSKTVKLTAKDGEGKGKASGSIVLRDDSGLVARRALNISEAAADTSKLTLLVSTVSVDFGSGEEPIWVPVKGSREEVATLLKDGLSAGQTVGAVFGHGEPYPVVYAGVKELGPEAAKVKLELDRLEKDLPAGTYSGKADLSPDAEGGDVTLEIKMSDSIWAAIFLLVAGSVIGIYVQWVGGTSVPRARLLARINNLASRAKAASIEVTKAAQGKKWSAIAIGNVAKLEEDLRKKVEDTMFDKRMVQIDKEVVDSNDTEIAAVEAQLDLLRDYPKHAQGLQAALDVPQAKTPDLEADRAERKLETEARKLLASDPVDAGALKTRFEQMDLRTQQVLSLRELEAWLKELWLEAEEFDGREPANQDVDTVREVLREAWDRLSSADEAEELEEALDLLRRARDELLPLRAKFRRPALTGLESIWAERPGSIDALATRIATMGIEPAAGETGLVAAEAASPPPLSREQATRVIDAARGYQWGVVAISAILALVTGLLALYFGKTWGWDNPVDFLTAIVWGAGSQAAITTLIASWNDLGSLRGLLRR